MGLFDWLGEAWNKYTSFLDKSSFQESVSIPFTNSSFQYAYNLDANKIKPIDENSSGIALFGGGVGAGVALLIAGFIAYKVLK